MRARIVKRAHQLEVNIFVDNSIRHPYGLSTYTMCAEMAHTAQRQQDNYCKDD
jgi:hypothetical protein